ncbi:hypothetical protein NM688_g8432 [Phlebia brevispora]|uniref:Uncharacterized protein n=1 Tax=Phlebia brevispora TaxID=194682 RepID=A0ACC1RUM3_9APHY|nr:hypothetical protein NM688_g8432 [Phlebia brevispora]
MNPPAAAAHKSNEVRSLEVLLRRTEEPEWPYFLSGAPERLTNDEIGTLLGLLKKLGMRVGEAERLVLRPAPTMLHCMRCHEEYVEENNAYHACYIEHVPAESSAEDQKVRCRVCGVLGTKIGTGGYVKWRRECCLEELHTTYEEDVEYNGENILTCRERGCYAARQWPARDCSSFETVSSTSTVRPHRKPA